MESTRLPGKVLMRLKDSKGLSDSLLGWVLTRANKIRGVDQVVLLIPKSPPNYIISTNLRFAKTQIFVERGKDLLDSFYEVSLVTGATHIVRITADCPLLDPYISGVVVAKNLETGVDYTTNEGYPRGLDTEICTLAALKKANKLATDNFDRRSVTSYIYSNPNFFSTNTVIAPDALYRYPELRLTVDELPDYQLVKEIYKNLPSAHYHFKSVLDILKKNPELQRINSGVKQKEFGID